MKFENSLKKVQHLVTVYNGSNVEWTKLQLQINHITGIKYDD